MFSDVLLVISTSSFFDAAYTLRNSLANDEMKNSFTLLAEIKTN